MLGHVLLIIIYLRSCRVQGASCARRKLAPIRLCTSRNASTRALQSMLGSREQEASLVGFFGAPRRFNVAVTRAKALLCVVGHPAVLRQDAYWSALVRALGQMSFATCLVLCVVGR